MNTKVEAVEGKPHHFRVTAENYTADGPVVMTAVVYVNVDESALAKEFGPKAMRNKGKKAQQLRGSVRIGAYQVELVK